MKVGQRLFIAVVPAVLGVLTVAGLAYWGRYAREAPEVVVAIAVVAALISLGAAWVNTRYVAQRVAHLAAAAEARVSPAGAAGDRFIRPAPVDELDAIEATVQGLSSAVEQARDDGMRRAQAAQERAAETASLLDEAVRIMASRLQEAELPLHILLSSPFGELNENQEEMLGAAQSAVGAADAELRQLQKLIAIDRGALAVVVQPIGLRELLRPALAIADARAGAARVRLSASVSESAPRVVVDPVHAQEALTAVITTAIARTDAGEEVTVDAREGEDGDVQIGVSHGDTDDAGSSLASCLARRLLATQGGTLTEEARRTVVGLPSEQVSPVAGGSTSPR